MSHNIELTDWLKEANIDIDQILNILQHSKPLESMDIFYKLKQKDSLLEQKFAQFSKLLCSVLPREGVLEVISTKSGVLYTVPTSKKRRKK